MYKKILLDKLTSNKLTLDDFDLQNTFTNYIISQMKKHHMTIGKGVVGKVYYIDNTYVVKRIMPCKFDKKNELYKYCQDIKNLDNRLIQLIPSGNGKYRYILPNLLSEVMIGTILGNFDHGFSTTHASMILEEHDDLSIYIVINKLNPMLTLTNKNIYYVLFQVAHSIMNAQQKYKFTHYDLHIDNLLWDTWPAGIDILHYEYDNKKFSINKWDCPFIIKISDFASSRLETKNIIVAPSNDTYPVISYGEFNPNYDFICLMGSILIYTKFRHKFTKLLSDKVLYKALLQLVLWFFNDDYIIGNKNLDDVRDRIADKYYKNVNKDKNKDNNKDKNKDKENKYSYRPKTDDNYIPYVNTKSMIDVVYYLSKFIHNTNKNIGNIINTNNLSPYRRNTDIILYHPTLKIIQTPTKNDSVVKHASMVVDDNIVVSKYHVLYNKLPNKRNLTLETKQKKQCPVQDQYITTIYVNHNHKQKFMFDCCKLDGVNYLLNNHAVGFVMNGGFYAYKDDFLPIGPYRDKYNAIHSYDIPKAYKDVYGYIILKNNKLFIEKTYNGIDEVCTAAPILIYNGVVVFHGDDAKYNCGDKKKNKDLYISQTEDKIKLKGHYNFSNHNGGCDKNIVIDPVEYARCDKIKPGNLQHANNPNPRAAFCILSNGDYVFVCFEGRDKEGVGIDLESMADALLSTYPNIKHAIANDGGASAALIFRTKEEQDKIYVSNPGRFKYYPVGNIIGLFN